MSTSLTTQKYKKIKPTVPPLLPKLDVYFFILHTNIYIAPLLLNKTGIRLHTLGNLVFLFNIMDILLY